MEEGSTTLTRDLVARLPVRFRSAAARALLVWLYCDILDLTSLSMPCSSYRGSAGAWEQWPRRRTFCSESIRLAMVLSAVLYLTLFHWKLRRYWSTGSRHCMSFAPPERHGGASRTIVDCLVLLHLGLVAVEYRPQAVADLVHDALARRIELRQLVGLLHQRIERSDLEFGDRKGGCVAAI
jgi:hypothetical protein